MSCERRLTWARFVHGWQVSAGWRTGYDKWEALQLWAVEINVVRRYRLWPRSLIQPPLAQGDKLVFARLASMERRRPEMKVTSSFTSEADEDPL
jgi:hypothetical protein